ncbi:MAG: hypothetical protein KA715_04845 [Xanthomonadaceae bacterium]|nr:hypothetical protein [Xanthomonadaceae bacterium]
MVLAILFISQFVHAQYNAQSTSFSKKQESPVELEIKQTIRAVEDQFDLFCEKDKTPGFFQHFSFCSGEYNMSKPCAKKTIYECKNRAGKVTKKIKTWVTYDMSGNATKLVKIKVKNK